MSKRDKVDTDRCYFCPQNRNIEAHHIVPNRFNGKDTRENLVGVCERCHKKLERLYDKRFYERLGITDEQGERKAHYPCSWNCSEQATVEVYHPQLGSEWCCKQHATELYANKTGVEVKEDLTGDMELRVNWIDDIKQVILQ